VSAQRAEIAYTLARLQAELEDLAVGGLRAAGPDRLRLLESMQQELSQAGATHLAERLGGLAGTIRDGSRQAAGALMRTQASLRLLERLLTLDTAAGQLRALEEDAGADV
jgi:hypothetical protein